MVITRSGKDTKKVNKKETKEDFKKGFCGMIREVSDLKESWKRMCIPFSERFNPFNYTEKMLKWIISFEYTYDMADKNGNIDCTGDMTGSRNCVKCQNCRDCSNCYNCGVGDRSFGLKNYHHCMWVKFF